jgi:hypothetical protein
MEVGRVSQALSESINNKQLKHLAHCHALLSYVKTHNLNGIKRASLKKLIKLSLTVRCFIRFWVEVGLVLIVQNH